MMDDGAIMDDGSTMDDGSMDDGAIMDDGSMTMTAPYLTQAQTAPLQMQTQHSETGA